MIIVRDVQLFDNMPPEQYFSIPAISNSFVNNYQGPTTAKMRFGSLVDTYTFEPHLYRGEQYKLVKAVSEAVIKKLGPLVYTGRRQLVVVCTMIYNNMAMRFKGRVDLFAGSIVIDLKVSELPIDRSISHFRYDLQLSGYMIALQCQVSVLISVHPKTCKVSEKALTITPGYWESVIEKYGIPVVNMNNATWSHHFAQLKAKQYAA